MTNRILLEQRIKELEEENDALRKALERLSLSSLNIDPRYYNK